MSPPAADAGAATTAAETVAAFAAGLHYEDIPPDVVARAKHAIVDTVGAATFGAQFPWSRAVIGYALRNGAGTSPIAGTTSTASPPMAALANGTLAHAFELDSYRYPGAGVHPGAALVPALLAVGHERQSSGREVVTAFVAGCEVLCRIGLATKHTSEALGFHAPGLTSTFAAAVAAGLLMDLDARRIALALGITGSLCSGLLAFSAAARGGMVKRLHIGRASEGGVLAASLAADGFEGPPEVLEGRFGFLHAYARDPDATRLTAGLGEVWETRNLGFKRYSAHLTAHTPIQSASELRAEQHFTGDDVGRAVIETAPKVISHHAIYEPADLTTAQYSVPFCVALALSRDAGDPRSFSEATLADPSVRALTRRVQCVADASFAAWQSRTTITLHDGRTFSRELARFRGMPFPGYDAADDVRDKWRRLVAASPAADTLLHQLEHLEEIADVRDVRLTAVSTS